MARRGRLLKRPHFEWAVLDLSSLPEAQLGCAIAELKQAEASGAFDLSQSACRAKLVRLNETDHLLLITMHHIVCDGWSAGILVEEFAQLYQAFVRGEASPLPPLEYQYGDFAVCQREWFEDNLFSAQLEYWKEQLAGLEVVEVPIDHPRPRVMSYRGASVPFALSGELTETLKAIGRREGVTLYMVLLAAFNVVLARYSGQNDLAVGSPIANRTRVEIEKLIGDFVNTLVLRTKLGGDPSWKELLIQVRQTALDAYKNQDVPFEMLVEALQPERDLSRTPLFQHFLVLQNAGSQELRLEGLAIAEDHPVRTVAKYEMALDLTETASGLRGYVEYACDLFDEATIRRFAEHFRGALQSLAAGTGEPVSRALLLSAEERIQVLVEWNRTEAEYRREKCLQEFFEEQAARTPAAVALRHKGERISYGDLERRANQLGRYLRELGIGAEKGVGICLERGPQMIVAMLGALKAGGFYVPIDPKYPAERSGAMVADANLSVLVTEEGVGSEWPGCAARVVYMDHEGERIGRESAEPVGGFADADNLAYVIYTSGSTGKPKGVAIRHRSAAAFVCWAQGEFAREELAGVLASTSICFDLSVFEIFVPLSVGGTVVLVENALELAERAAPGEVTLLNTVPSAMRELLRLEGVPGSVQTVNLAGEALAMDVVEELYRQAGVRRVLNLYGPSEDTTYSSYAVLERESESAMAPIGRPVANTRCYVLDSRLEALPVGVPGELYLGGAGLARGYLHRPELTAERFVPDGFGGEPGERLYRTGDLVRWRGDGTLEFLGRLDHQVKVRGFRIELGEIEAVLREQEAVEDAVVLVHKDDRGDQRLVGYVVGRAEASELREYLKRRLPEYMVPGGWVWLDKLPTNPNGKVDRAALQALKARFTREDIDAQEQALTPTEEILCGLWEEVLQVRPVAVSDNFFDLGGHSLLATQVFARIQQAFSVDLPLRAIFELPTVRGLAKAIEMRKHGGTEVPPLVRRKQEGPAVLSHTQQRLWFIAQLDPQASSYNLTGAASIEGDLRVATLEASLNELVARHEALRTRFVTMDGEPRQIIEAATALAIPLIDLEPVPVEDRALELERLLHQEAQIPFDLATCPLLRIKLFRVGREHHVLLVVMHHIISDAWSISVLMRELSSLYNALSAGQSASLPELPVQYADFTVWQRQWLDGGVLEEQLSYWKKQMAGAATLELPSPRARPRVLSGDGEFVNFTLSEALTEELKSFSRQQGATLYMTCLAAFQALLFHYTQQDDIVVGTSVAGRRHMGIEGIVGCFINMLALRTNLSGTPSFSELLRRVSTVTLEAYAHQDVPFEKVVEALQPARDLSRSPLFQVMFVFHNVPQSELQLGTARLEMMNIESSSTKFDLTLYMSEVAGRLEAAIQYSTDLFDRASIGRMAEHYQIVVKAAAADPEEPIASIALITEEEERQVLNAWNEAALEWSEQEELLAGPSGEA